MRKERVLYSGDFVLIVNDNGNCELACANDCGRSCQIWYSATREEMRDVLSKITAAKPPNLFVGIRSGK